MAESWLDRVAGLAGLDGTAQALLAAVPKRSLPRGTVVFRPGDEVRAFFIVLAGRIAVTITASTGREILLYEVAGGETCVQTTVALMGARRYEGEARVVEDADAIVIPRPVFDRLMAESTAFRGFVFASFGRRLSDVIHLLERVAFLPIESRLAGMLLLRAGAGGAVSATHQELASAIDRCRLQGRR